MQPSQWYELRVQGSIGTREGTVRGVREGVAISDDGHVCSTASPYVKHFASEQAAMDYLGRCTVPGKSQFEIVLCRAASFTENTQPQPI